jgi:long-subunit fatty acid transport protein
VNPRLALAAASALAFGLLTTEPARASGLEAPDLGVQALGRGAAFTARADDGMAVLYNVGGFAQQRGTKLTLSTNVAFSDTRFARAGKYLDDARDPATPWGGKNYPVVGSTGGPAIIPSLVVSSDFGLDRWTFAAAFFTPSPAGGGTFPLGVANGVPNPARYMALSTAGLVAFPTAAASYRVTDSLDVGLAAHLVVVRVDSYSVSYFDFDPGTCKNAEYQPCDALSRVQTEGSGGAASIGALYRVSDTWHVGLNLRSGFSADTTGTVQANAPKILSASSPPAEIQVSLSMPWIARFGVRHIIKTGKFETADIEVNGTYEAWSSASKTRVFIPKLGDFKNVDQSIDNGYTDAGSLRVGGAYNLPALGGIGTLRAGAFYDASAVPVSRIRPGQAALDKLGLTLGAGLEVGAVRLNVAYAAVLSPEVEVKNGDIILTNAARQGVSRSADDKPYGAVNNGTYSAQTHIVSFGAEVAFDKLFAKDPPKAKTPEDT